MVPAVIATGELKVTCCHPELDSFVAVAVASRVPVLDHKFALCIPVLPALL